MSSVKDQVYDAISEGNTTAKDVADATGLEVAQVHSQVYFLKKEGKIAKNEHGYCLADGGEKVDDAVAAVLRKAAHHTQPQRADDEAGVPPKRSRKSKPIRKPKQPRAQRVTAPAAEAPAIAPVEFARFGEFVVLKRADVVELLQTLERWRQMIESVPA